LQENVADGQSKQFQNNKYIIVFNAAPLGPLDEGAEETIYTE